MSKTTALALLLLLVASLVTLPLPVKAKHIIVVPDKYPTVTAAIGNATDGDVILVRSGTYYEQSLKSNHSISLIGEETASTIINLNPPIISTTIFTSTFTGPDNAVKLLADNVVVSGLTLNCYGAFWVSGDHTVVKDNCIKDYAGCWMYIYGNYNTIANNSWNTVMDLGCSYSKAYGNTGSGSIVISDSGSHNSIFENQLTAAGSATLSSSNLYYRNVIRNGLGIYANLNDIVYNNTVADCSHGIYMPSGSNNVVIGNRVVNNHGEGLSNNAYVQGSFANCGADNVFTENYVSGNDVGILIDTSYQWHGANFSIYNNNFIDNIKQVSVVASNSSNDYQNYLFSIHPQSDFWNYNQQGNYWSDYKSNYPSATETNSVWNLAYNVGGDEQDNYPLVLPIDLSKISYQLPAWADVSASTSSQNYIFPQQAQETSSPAPTVPEFPAIAILPILAVIPLIAMLLIRKYAAKTATRYYKKR